MPNNRIALTIFACAVFVVKEIQPYCRVEECSNWFQKTKDYENILPSNSMRYCQIVWQYSECLNSTRISCRGHLSFHSSQLVVERQSKYFNCTQFDFRDDENNKKHGLEQANICYYNPPPTSHRKMRYCTLFGDPHLLKFDGTFETCSEEGARPLVDNRYFLVQVTNKNVRGEALTTTVSKVTVLIRKHNCTGTLKYEASADEQFLSRGFVDGTTHSRDHRHNRNSVEVLWQESNYIEIALHFIHSSIHIRRQGPYLAVSIKSPTNVLETGSSLNELCWKGCRKSAKIRIEDAFEKPNDFAKCYARRVHVPIRIAEDRCREIGTMSNFFSACVFDLMLTGDDNLVLLSNSSQSDFHRLAPHHLVNRLLHNPISSPNSSPIFTNCLTPSFSDFNSFSFSKYLAIIISIIYLF
ncbi:unnamed protein product [Caenorhabditis angaria]|uniref:Uncharacterized protein n=1 Tax=Caenorhabditis angaria TaxID=860376 RepID=A0A9P1MSB3_9PELO|nr:unnamed protein product [Caenorhabditis angaria]